MVASGLWMATLALPAAGVASNCELASTPESCLGSSSCAWLMLSGTCVSSDSSEVLASPPSCCSSTASNTTCSHSSAELPDGICALPSVSTNAAFDLSYTLRMAHVAGASYCSGDSITSWTCGTHCSSAKGLEMVQYISNEKEVLAGFVAWDSSIKAIVVSFRGTVQSITDWVHNLAFTKTNPFSQLPDVGVHHGFWDSWQALSSPVLAAIQNIQKTHSGAKVVLTGHSLGAAIAADAALDMAVNHGLSVSVVNFGSPRPGDSGFHSALQQHVGGFWRVTHAKDLVPHVPPESFGFYHASTEVFFPGTDTKYQICDGSGEDSSCSDECAKTLSCVSVSDHLNYFGVSLGGDGCDASVVV